MGGHPVQIIIMYAKFLLIFVKFSKNWKSLDKWGDLPWWEILKTSGLLHSYIQELYVLSLSLNERGHESTFDFDVYHSPCLLLVYKASYVDYGLQNGIVTLTTLQILGFNGKLVKLDWFPMFAYCTLFPFSGWFV